MPRPCSLLLALFSWAVVQSLYILGVLAVSSLSVAPAPNVAGTHNQVEVDLSEYSVYNDAYQQTGTFLGGGVHAHSSRGYRGRFYRDLVPPTGTELRPEPKQQRTGA